MGNNQPQTTRDEEEVYETGLSISEICLLPLCMPNMQIIICKGCIYIMEVVRERRVCWSIDNTRIGEEDKCEFALEDCPKECGKRLSKKRLEYHLKKECDKRIVLQDHFETCMKFIVCPNSCDQEDIMRENIQKECSFRENGCMFKGTNTDIEKHMAESLQEHLLLLAIENRSLKNELKNKDIRLGSEVSTFSIDELLQYHNEKECTKTHQNCFFRENGCMFEGTNTDIEKHMAESLQEHLMLLTIESRSLEREVSDLRNKLQKKDKQVGTEISNFSTEEQDDVLIDVNKHFDFRYFRDYRFMYEEFKKNYEHNENMYTMMGSISKPFIWMIPNFEALFQDAKSGKTPAIHSIPFYSCIPGYRMCLNLNLNGIASGLNTHISMFLHFMQGDYDSIVTWPFNGSLKFKVMQQDPTDGQPKHIEETLTSRPTLQAFLRPRTTRNHKGYGCVEMVSHEILYNQGYVKEDALIVSVEVTPEKVKKPIENEEKIGYKTNSPHIENWQAEKESCIAN